MKSTTEENLCVRIVENTDMKLNHAMNQLLVTA